MLRSPGGEVPPNPGIVVAIKRIPDSRMLGSARRFS
jgi:hypothetical protein